jgi:uncharacterized SAM-binding protein YcdF (DUF218 family)
VSRARQNESDVKTRRAPKVFPAHGRQASAKSGKTPVRFLDFSLADAEARRAPWDLFTRKMRWGLSWRGWLILAFAVFLAGALFMKGAYPFLAITHRVGDGDVLVVEGWVHQYAIRAAVDEFRSGSYRRVFTTGGPVVGTGRYINDAQTSASVGAGLLRKDGLSADVVQMVPSHVIGRDRTYSSAVALRDWIQEHQPSVRRINVLTENTHARRTRLLFQEAFGKEADVGIISVPNPDYDQRRWWRYSQGVKDVGSESLSYVYAKFFFWPSESGNGTTNERE